ncbi:MATE family efflux transporter [Mucilaginibacter sp. RB4R14]|uniref:MATE family efflux transporter n=1 Tax=Mucilaginibacter aurantiaciroseus TaxID=2949308 RepID=UPI0020906863|nr:MATE family efflux transporter [Mucilaginibacter aurantiaciroseus]MCO5934660.1 MATE family efflux transporter [Mucilaginibacter aurantiaciroseus]
MDKKTLRWNFIFQYGYVITNIINSIILLPFYLKKIDASTLGVWLATGNILAWMTLIDPGIGEVLQQKIAELRGKKLNDEVSKTIGSGLIAAGLILLLAIVAGFVFYSLIGLIINKDVSKYPNLQIALFITIISTGMTLTSFSMSGINQGLQNASQVAISSILANILFFVINITLLIYGFGIISIAFANLCRAVFINIYNFSTLKTVLNRNGMEIIFENAHFKKFIRIFSFTSLASIIGGFSASMDTIVLARFIPPSMITIFEINKRPIQMTQSLVGRHSVALMPSISHASGTGDRAGIINLITTQFKYYSYAALFMALVFCFNYRELITAWTGTGKYAGDTIIYLLVANFFFGLIGYFMANIGYALGDIKMNSLVNILKGLIIGVLYYVSARQYGIPGILSVMLAGNILIDFSLFSFRLIKLGYLEPAIIKSTLGLWVILVPVMLIVEAGCHFAVNQLIQPDMHIIKLMLNGGIFMLLFITIVLTADQVLRTEVINIIKSMRPGIC